MRIPTEEQISVLEDSSRIRIVRAAPGSGKTWLVSELIRKELTTWKKGMGAIAALSFTRVGGEEIRGALGYELDHPHFIGTIDAFLFRYVVRPFFQKVYADAAPPRLIPSDWSPYTWIKNPANGDWNVRLNNQNYHLLNIRFVDQNASGPVVAYPNYYSGGLDLLPISISNNLINLKRSSWKKFGWLTHSDATFISQEILSHSTLGPEIRKEIVRRFSLLIVDELQDTGFYLARCIKSLLSENGIRGVLAGDPDQAIYEFNGAKPVLFDEFNSLNGAKRFPLGISRRCPEKSTKVAIQLSDSGQVFQHSETNNGRAILLRYGNMVPEIKSLVTINASRNSTGIIKVITRSNSTIDELTEKKVSNEANLYQPILTRMYNAVCLFRQGLQVGALSASRAALEKMIFGYEGVDETTLLKKRFIPEDWKALTVRCLLRANEIPSNGTIFDWQCAIGQLLNREVQAHHQKIGLAFEESVLKPQKRPGWDEMAVSVLVPNETAALSIGNVPIKSIHAVKGETHDLTILVWPNPRSASKCPSEILWSDNPGHREERRIMYVGVTRTRGDLILCVSNSLYERLIAKRPSFVNLFEVMTIPEYLAGNA